MRIEPAFPADCTAVSPVGRMTRASYPAHGRLWPWMLLALIGAWPGPMGPVGSVRASPPQERRWLLAIETSKSMAARKPGLHEAIRHLFLSGFDHRLQPGDSIGVWTFDREVYTGQFPLQSWVPERAEAIAHQLHTFLDTRTFQSVGELTTPLGMAEQIAKRSANFTLILFCTGDQTVIGTPFDGPIHEAVRDMRTVQRRIRQPVIIVLRSEQGQWVDYAVGQPPWPVRIPATPIERQREMAPAIATESKSASAPGSHPGRDSAFPVAENAPAPSPPQTDPHPSREAQTASAPTPARPIQSEISTPPTEPSTPLSRPSTAPPAPTGQGTSGPKQSPGTLPEVALSKPQNLPAEETAEIARPGSAPVEGATSFSDNRPAIPTDVAPLGTSRPPAAATAPAATHPISGGSLHSAPPAARQPDVLPSPPSRPGTVSAGLPAGPIFPGPETLGVYRDHPTLPREGATSSVADTNRAVGRIEPSEAKPGMRPPPWPTIPNAAPATNQTGTTLATATPGSTPRRTGLLAAGLACLLTALLGALWLAQRSRTTPGHGSLITHSLDRQSAPAHRED